LVQQHLAVFENLDDLVIGPDCATLPGRVMLNSFSTRIVPADAMKNKIRMKMMSTIGAIWNCKFSN
jgi:hypothetical protein